MLRVLLIISGSIAAYKSLDLIRRLRERGARVTCVLTGGGAQFITPLSVASLSGEPVYGELFSLKDESEMGHIRLSREADLVLVAPASADLLAKMASGRADDLAGAVLLATDKKVLAAPAMNTQMWKHPATQRNLERLAADGVIFIAPGAGLLACGEEGDGRMAEVCDIVRAVFAQDGALAGRTALVTSGPTQEPLDPVRYLGNRSSGKQGHAVARALQQAGASVTLVTGPTSLPDPAGVEVRHVRTAREMLAACEAALPVDVAVCAAAVADWRSAAPSNAKIKKHAGSAPAPLELVENPDILHRLATHDRRPKLVVGFAAETEDLEANAVGKLHRKGCDWIVANDVSGGKAFDAGDNQVALVTASGVENWPLLAKDEVARRLAVRIAEALA